LAYRLAIEIKKIWMRVALHHRAQLTVVDRLLGIVPHLTGNREAARTTAAKRASKSRRGKACILLLRF